MFWKLTNLPRKEHWEVFWVADAFFLTPPHNWELPVEQFCHFHFLEITKKTLLLHSLHTIDGFKVNKRGYKINHSKNWKLPGTIMPLTNMFRDTDFLAIVLLFIVDQSSIEKCKFFVGDVTLSILTPPNHACCNMFNTSRPFTNCTLFFKTLSHRDSYGPKDERRPQILIFKHQYFHPGH